VNPGTADGSHQALSNDARYWNAPTSASTFDVVELSHVVFVLPCSSPSSQGVSSVYRGRTALEWGGWGSNPRPDGSVPYVRPDPVAPENRCGVTGIVCEALPGSVSVR